MEEISNKIKEISCQCCGVGFTISNVPKLLHCGHSFCVTCILLTRIQGRKCQVCNYTCSEEELKNPPTNHALLMAIRRLEEHLNLTRSIESRFTATLNLILESGKKMKSSAPLNVCYKQIYFDGLQIHEKLNLINNPFQLVKLAKKFTKKFTIPISLQPKNFNDFQYFLPTIIAFLNHGYNFYAAHRVDNKILYGKLSTQKDWENTLFMHSLTEEGHEIGANIIWFQDIKDNMKRLDLMTFIEIPCLASMQQKLVFVMDNLLSAAKFIKKCTGECGATYKNLFYKAKTFKSTDEIGTLTLNGYTANNQWTENPNDYAVGLHVKHKTFENCFVLQTLDNGGFNILRCDGGFNRHANVIGKMHEFCSSNKSILGFNWNYFQRKKIIIDCGIALSTVEKNPTCYRSTFNEYNNYK